MNYSLNRFYDAIGVSRQGVHDMLNRMQRNFERELTILHMIELIRENHPTMSLRSLYIKIQPQGLGRDKFIRMCISHGLKAEVPRNMRRTTNSNGVIRFPNLLKGIEIVRVNQAWLSDITYFEIGDKFYYITLIMDAYSRYIKGYSASGSMRTERTTIPAMKMALKEKDLPEKMIFHSDGGGQYYCQEFIRLTSKMKMQNSMAKEAYENPFAERINGTIKNCYLKHWSIGTLEQLEKSLDRAVRLYNYDKPHKSLQGSTPAQLEGRTYIRNGQTAKGEESLTARLITSGASSPLVIGQTAKGSDVHPARGNER